MAAVSLYPPRRVGEYMYSVDTMRFVTPWRHTRPWTTPFSARRCDPEGRTISTRSNLRLPVARVKYRVPQDTKSNVWPGPAAHKSPLDVADTFTLFDNVQVRFDTCGWYSYSKPKPAIFSCLILLTLSSISNSTKEGEFSPSAIMLDPTLPWLAVGYKNFKQEDFCQRQIKDEMNKYRIETTNVLRSTTPQRQQRRRVKSATHARFIPRCGSNSPAYTSSPARPKSAQSYHHKTTLADQIAERTPSRQRRPRSAFLSHHKPSLAQNRSISMVEREHHEEKMIRLFVDERDKKCAFCPVECRPKSSSSNRPTSSTGLVAAQLPTHYDRYVYSTRPRTAPATRREFQLPRHNNIRRGQVPHYTNFVRRVELGLRDGTPSPPPRRRIAFENDPVKPQSPTFVESSHGDVEEEEMLPSVGNEEEEFDDVSIHIPSPTDHLLVPEFIESEEPPTDESQEAWTEPKAPTPSPAMSGRNSPTPVVDDTPEQPSPPPREPTPPPREPTPPIREPTPPPREPTPPPREPTPPPREPTPPPREPTPPPREPTPPPREPTPPPAPKPKKEVRIQETPILPPAKPKTIPQPTDIKTKSCLVKKAEIPKEPEQKKPEPPEVQVDDEKPEEVVVEVAVEEIEDEPQEEDKNKEEKQSKETRRPEKKKLGPAPKFKVDLFSMDSGNILDVEMKLRRKGGENRTSDGDSFADIPEYLLKRRQPWQYGRMALSRRACRFEIPMDVFVLENMSPTEYLQQYCFVNKRRQAMYRRSFSKVDKDNDMKINMKEFNTAVLEALVGTVQLEQVQEVLELIQADKFPHFGPKLFSAICSLLERLHYREFVTEDTVDQEGLVEKEKVEDADFLALDWKFDGCKINEPLKRLLYML